MYVNHSPLVSTFIYCVVLILVRLFQYMKLLEVRRRGNFANCRVRQLLLGRIRVFMWPKLVCIHYKFSPGPMALSFFVSFFKFLITMLILSPNFIIVIQ